MSFAPSERSPLLNLNLNSHQRRSVPDRYHGEDPSENDSCNYDQFNQNRHNQHRPGLPLSTTLIGLAAFLAMLLLERQFHRMNSGTIKFKFFQSPAKIRRSNSPDKIVVDSNLLGSPLVTTDDENINISETTASYGDMTFAELGVYLIQQHYAESLEVIDKVFVESVQPMEVAVPRKVLLKTRDLLDIFSPMYPANSNTTHQGNKANHHFDLWTKLRWEMAKGYQIVGEFLDLNHAHINYSQASCDKLRNEILEWKANFTIFRQDHPEIPVYLALPLQEGRVHHAKESRFFWLNTPKKGLPRGSSGVTTMLQRLAIYQSNLALQYLNHTMHFETIIARHTPEEQLQRQKYFHNLRKTLRAICDEVDVLGADVFRTDPFTPSFDAEFALLSKARGVLGDLNDLWTAYDFYVQHNKLRSEQDRLALAVDADFIDFKQWAKEEDLEGTLHYMIQVMTGPPKNGFHRKPKSLAKFLKIAKKYPTRSIVIGNKAGDADSVISAIALSYIETYAPVPVTLTRKSPIVSISKQEFRQLRPEINLLLELAGLLDPAKDLLFVSSSAFKTESREVHVTLVDHNVIEGELQDRNWKVVEIIDHHEDQGLYPDSDPRVIAYEEGNALVASACTLVAERMVRLWEPPYPTSIALLLMGVILLDSVNLSEKAGKVTQRDIDAVHNLLNKVDWQTLPKSTQYAIGINDDKKGAQEHPDTNLFFNVLQDAKYSTDFWNSMSVRDALRYDYKDFDYKKGVFGISTILMPMDDFLHKQKLIPSMLRFMQDYNIGLLGIMFAYEDNDHLRRELMICSDGHPSIKLSQLEHKLMGSSLNLEEMPGFDAFLGFDATGLNARFYNQQNIAASRKQIGPLLQTCLNGIL